MKRREEGLCLPSSQSTRDNFLWINCRDLHKGGIAVRQIKGLTEDVEAREMSKIFQEIA